MGQSDIEQEENKQMNVSSINTTVCNSRIFWLRLLKAHYSSLRIYLIKPEKAEDSFIRFENGILKILQVKIINLSKCVGSDIVF